MTEPIDNIDLVLLVDDNSIDNFVNQKMIERYGFAKKVLAYTKASDALKYLSELDELKSDLKPVPSILFLDLNMPLINGFQFLELYEKLSDYIKSSCKIVVLSSSVNPNDKALASSNKHIISYLHKPLLNSNFQELNTLLKENSTSIK